MSKEIISVIVPVYNVELYLERCIQSICRQSYSNLEIILIDDGSLDRCPEICDQLAQQDSRIAVIHKANGGLSSARNAGLRAASGDYIGFIDSDDWIEPDMYECLYNLLEEYQADIAICGANSVDSEGKIVGTGKYPEKILGYKQVTIYENEQILAAHLKPSNDINAGVWNKLYRREIVEGIEFPESKLYEDVFTTYKYLDRASRVVKCKSHKYNYFQRADSICGKPFTANNFDSVQANKERYLFIKKEYPDLESMARERLLTNMLNIGFRLAKTNQLTEFRNELAEAITDIRPMKISGCGLSKKQEWGIRLMCTNLGLFELMVKKIYS